MNNQLPFVSCIFGKAGSGKSTLINYLLHDIQSNEDAYSRFERALVFTKTKFNHAYNFIPNQWVNAEYDENKLKALMNLLGSIRARGKMPRPTLILFDDCVEPSMFRKGVFRDLIYNRRHYNISVVLAFQYMMGNSPTFLRENCDFVCVFKQFSENSIKGIYSAFGFCFESEQEYLQQMRDLPKYHFIYIDSRENTSAIMIAPENVPTPEFSYSRTVSLSSLRDA